MKKGLSFIFALLIAKSAPAISFKPAATTKNNAAPAVKVLTLITECLKNQKDVLQIRQCSAKSFDKSLSQAQKDRILAWFETNLELSYPTVCSKEQTEFIPDSVLTKTKLVVCSSYKKGPLNKTALFFFSESPEGLQLLNVKH